MNTINDNVRAISLAKSKVRLNAGFLSIGTNMVGPEAIRTCGDAWETGGVGWRSAHF